MESIELRESRELPEEYRQTIEIDGDMKCWFVEILRYGSKTAWIAYGIHRITGEVMATPTVDPMLAQRYTEESARAVAAILNAGSSYQDDDQHTSFSASEHTFSTLGSVVRDILNDGG